jgi:NADH:ubiquinone oxidoreductase subunit 6 (subunit J)
VSLLSLLFYGFEILAALSAVGILFVRNAFHAALLLIVCLLSLAAIFIVANAEFIAVTQILVYAGGILVLMIFGIMLTSKIQGKPLHVNNQYVFAGSLVAAFFSFVLIMLFTNGNFYQQSGYAAQTPYNSINLIGITLMSDYVLPLEIAGLLLLIALLGAAVTASSFNTPKKS